LDQVGPILACYARDDGIFFRHFNTSKKERPGGTAPRLNTLPKSREKELKLSF
jgi:hypothetical protein